jgi:hypothetical protein
MIVLMGRRGKGGIGGERLPLGHCYGIGILGQEKREPQLIERLYHQWRTGDSRREKVVMGDYVTHCSEQVVQA